MQAQSIWAYQDNFDWRTDIDANHPFYVPLDHQRGEYTRREILTLFGLDEQGALLSGATHKKDRAILFGGHVGSGKSTELRLLAQRFEKSYTVLSLELTKELDINNLRFSDVLIALAKHLVKTLEQHQLLSPADQIVLINPVLNWFETRIIQRDTFRDLQLDLSTQASAKLGLPFLFTLLASITTKFQAGAAYRETLRNEIRNGFTQLLEGFNTLVAHANQKLCDQGKGPLLFLIDGSDKLSREDSQAFFSDDANQVRQIHANLIICSPISVLLEDGITAQHFIKRIRLPMVKLQERDGSERGEALQALVSLIEKRMPLALFDSLNTVHYLVRHSGGHPRDLLRLVHECFALVDDGRISRTVAERAVRNLAADYQRSVHQSDWSDLVAIDLSQGTDTDATENRRRLLYSLVLLEYNNFWWSSHPLVRTLGGYQRALAASRTTSS